jgi:2-oxoglutarate dehydrogenase E2 component (dihydrolipoamide succinyltransferase)
MIDIRIPKLNNNDESYVLTEWLVGDGEQVQPEDLIVTIETSKAAEDLTCGEAGVLRHLVPAGRSCAPGETIGKVFDPNSPEAARPLQAVTPSAQARDDDAELVITAPARALMERSGIGLDQVRGLGVKVIKQADIERLTAAQAATRMMPAMQQAVAKTVVRSHATIPSAYSVVRVDVGAAEEEARRQARQLRKLAGLPELLVAAVSSLHSAFPLFFATPIDDYSARLSAEPHVGVTIDVGKGLFVPVVKNADRLSFAGLAEVITGFRLMAASGTFKESDLSGGNIVVTLHNEMDVVMAIPIISPGMTCALALAGTHSEPGDAGVRSVANIGLAYDHRFINGRDALVFLQAVKKALESPAALIKGTEESP